MSVRPDDVLLRSDGVIALRDRGADVDDGVAAQDLGAVLARLMVAAGPDVPPNLMRLIERGPETGSWKLQNLKEELIRELLPLNRGASRRVLARMVREIDAGKPRAAGSSEPLSPSYSTQQDEPMLRPTPLPFATAPKPASASRPPTASIWPSSANTRPSAPAYAESIASNATERAQERSIYVDAEEEEQNVDSPERTASKTAIIPLFLLAAVFGVAAVAAYSLGRQAFFPTSESVQAPGVAAPIPAEKPVSTTYETGTLTINAEPVDAQLFLYVGRSPLTVTDLQPDAAYEFVAIDDRGVAARARTDVQGWSNDDPRLYELAIQVPTTASTPTRISLGNPVGETLGVTSGPGQVRVITTPPGLKVYRYLGSSPTVTVPELRADLGHEVLLYHPERGIERAVVSPSDWSKTASGHQAQLTIQAPTAP